MSKIMVVEDEGLIALSLQSKLESFGYEVPAVIHTGEEAISFAAVHNPDLILMDINLGGGITGITAAEKIHEKMDMPIIFLTAYSDDSTLEKAKKANPSTFLVKPFKDRELKAAVEMVLNKHANDVAKLREAKLKAQESDRLKSAFLANIGHEFRTPLNGILGFAELLEDTDLQSERGKEYFRQLGISGKRLTNLVNDFFNLSKIESGTVEIVPRETDFQKIIENLVDEVRELASQKGIQVSSLPDNPSKLAILKTDGEVLEAVLRHLAVNAIKFSNGGHVTIGYRQIENNGLPKALEFFVKDEGIGIPPDKQQIIFEPFRQVDESNNRKYEGSGLGLTISRRFAKLLGGDIRVESEVGKGSTFFLTLPLDPF